ncbi:hypothetical protein PV326_008285 [Microctonus aethiopoides]|uniref:Protein lethal(2)denticleless n=1 Tax=Microctonus aethiopoides TaxID=144406 RepID=A0AA39FJX9_9HYME|nr:hypothetical protein PV326_008285 [Microctonus aethiopoides]KAK0170977.1 hypothetical protein PV328_008752 [Microctonus aethiopoides]
MNIVDSLALRYTGFESRLQSDIAIKRLKCNYDDVYRGITPNTSVSNFNQDSPIYACRFSNHQSYPDLVALANEDGRFAVQNTSHKYPPNSSVDGQQAHFNAIFDVTWMPGELKFITASGDHSAKLWDVTNSKVMPVDKFISHTRSIKTVVFRPDNKDIFASGARDGAIFIWDVRDKNKKPDNSIFNGHHIGPSNNSRHRRSLVLALRAKSITGLVFQNDNTLISCAAGDGLIKVWDLRKNYTVHKNQPYAKHTLPYNGGTARNGFTSLAICPAQLKLYANCLDNVIYAYNLSSYSEQPIAEFYGHQNSTFYVKNCVSPDGQYLASGSSDENAYIWRTDKPGRPFIKLKGHTDEVTCVTWSIRDEPRIVTTCDDGRHRIWRVGLEHPGDNDAIEIHGVAEVVESTTLSTQLDLETTPSASRRWVARNETTPDNATSSSDLEQGHNVTPNTESSTSGKRSREQMSSGGLRINGHFKSILSPIEENLEPTTKRSHIENKGARRLFSPMRNNELRPTRDYDSDEAGPSQRLTSNKIQPPFSPTLNLPNFVIDGTAPHLIQLSPQKAKENVDWLTKIRKTRYERRLEKSESDKITSPNNQVTPARRNSRSRSSEPRRVKSPVVSLLNFFKVESPVGKNSIQKDSKKNSESPTISTNYQLSSVPCVNNNE